MLYKKLADSEGLAWNEQKAWVLTEPGEAQWCYLFLVLLLFLSSYSPQERDTRLDVCDDHIALQLGPANALLSSTLHNWYK